MRISTFSQTTRFACETPHLPHGTIGPESLAARKVDLAHRFAGAEALAWGCASA